MKKPQRIRIPLRPDARKAGGEERAYTSNYGDPKKPERPARKPRPEGEGDETRKPFFKKEEGGREGKKPFFKKDDGEKKPYQKREGTRDFSSKKEGYKKPYSRGEKSEKPFEKKERSSFKRTEGEENRSSYSGEKKPYQRREEGERKPYAKRDGGERKPYNPDAPRGERKPFEKREGSERKSFVKREGEERKPFGRKAGGENGGDFSPKKRAYNKPDGEGKSYEKKSFRTGEKSDRSTAYGSNRPRKDSRDSGEASGTKPRRRSFREGEEKPAAEGEGMTLNKYLSHAGICGRREAGELVKSGKVTVNGEVLNTPGYRVKAGDVVRYEDRVVKPEVAKVYVLLNKPKGFITTTDDEAERHTVMELVQGVEAERLYPVGRLDRNTTGVLLLTNDGDLAQRLTHPKYECKKIYQVTVDKDVTKADLEKLATGVTLEDGEIKADEVAYLETKKEIGIEIHSGRNRIVRRMFEHLGYTVEKLDRVMFAGLTKKNVPRGKYRLLTEKEVILLKHFKG